MSATKFYASEEGEGKNIHKLQRKKPCMKKITDWKKFSKMKMNFKNEWNEIKADLCSLRCGNPSLPPKIHYLY